MKPYGNEHKYKIDGLNRTSIVGSGMPSKHRRAERRINKKITRAITKQMIRQAETWDVP